MPTLPAAGGTSGRLPTADGPRRVADTSGGPVPSLRGVSPISTALGGLGDRLTRLGVEMDRREEEIGRGDAALAEARYRNAIAEGSQGIEERIRSGELRTRGEFEQAYGDLAKSKREEYFSGVAPKFLPSVQVGAEGTDIQYKGSLFKSLYGAQQATQEAQILEHVDEVSRSALLPGGDVMGTSEELNTFIRSRGRAANWDDAKIEKATQTTRANLFNMDLALKMSKGSEDLVVLDAIGAQLDDPQSAYAKNLTAEDRVQAVQRLTGFRRQLTAEKGAEVEKNIAIASRAAEDGISSTIDTDAFKYLPPDKRAKAADEMLRTQRLAENVRAVSTVSKADETATLTGLRDKMLAEQDPEKHVQNAQEYTAYSNAVALRKAALEKDSAAYIVEKIPAATQAAQKVLNPSDDPIKHAAAVSAYVEILKEEKARLGVRADDNRLLSGPAVAQAASEFLDQETGALKSAEIIYQQKALWGDAWPEVQDQLIKEGKLPEAISVIASGLPPLYGQKVAALSGLSKGELKKGGLERSGTTERVISEKVADLTKDFIQTNNTTPYGVRLSNSFYDAAERLVYDELRNGRDLDKAVQTAQTTLFSDVGGNARYDYSDSGTFYVPVEKAGYAQTDIERGSEVALQRLSLDQLSPFDNGYEADVNDPSGEQHLRALKRDIKWVTEQGERGLAATLNGRAVVGRDGNPITYTWEELGTANDDLVSLTPQELEERARRTDVPLADLYATQRLGRNKDPEASVAALPTEQVQAAQGTPIVAPQSAQGIAATKAGNAQASLEVNFPVRNGKPVAPLIQDATLATLPVEARRALPHDAPELDEYAQLVNEKYNLPDGLLLAIKNVGERSESTGKNSVSPKGARGVMQFMARTAESLGLTDPTDPLASIESGAEFLQELSVLYKGNVPAIVAHYNGGTAAGKAVVAGKLPPKKETRNYIQRVAAALNKTSQATAKE